MNQRDTDAIEKAFTMLAEAMAERIAKVEARTANLEQAILAKSLPPMPPLPPHELEEWSESEMPTLRGEGWTKETVEQYARDYAMLALGINKE